MEKVKKIRFKRINVIENKDVYDLKVQDNHNFFANGVLVHNCGEIFMNEDSCRLIHINLSSFVDNPFTEDAKVNEEKLYEVAYETMRLGDDLVDLERNAIKKILKKVEDDGDKDGNEYKLYQRLLDNTLQGRRCGVGIFGISDAVAKLGLKFDSDESIKAIDQMMKVVFIGEMDSEIDMALTRGTFPAYSKEIEDQGNDWYKMLETRFPDTYRRMKAYGRRNVSFSTAAPTGTVAMLAHCSSGIEPVFMPFYTRRVKCMNPTDRVDFVDKDGEKFTEYINVHPTLKEFAELKFGDTSSWNEKKWNEVYEKSPWYKACANDIEWSKRVEIQGVVQKYITHSISSCVVKDTLIETEDGGYMYIDEMYDFSDTKEGTFYDNEGFDKNVKTHTGECHPVKSFYNNGKKTILELKLSNGLSIKCTPNEKFLVFDQSDNEYKWKHLYDMQEGDIVKIN